MAELLLDTDVLVDVLRGARRLRLGHGQTAAYSVVTRCELFAGRHADEDRLRDLLDPLREHAVDRTIAEHAGRLRRQTGINTADALIAATALIHDLDLVTRNRRHFDPVPSLVVRVPTDDGSIPDDRTTPSK